MCVNKKKLPKRQSMGVCQFCFNSFDLSCEVGENEDLYENAIQICAFQPCPCQSSFQGHKGNLFKENYCIISTPINDQMFHITMHV